MTRPDPVVTAAARERSPTTRPWLRMAVFALLIAGATLLASHFGFFALRDPARLASAIRRARAVPMIMPLFVVTYAVVATFGLPAFPFTLAGGAMFGLVLGSFLSWMGALLGACGAYLLARLLGRDAVQGMLGKWGEKLDVLGARSGFSTILRLRLIPVVPFNLVSIAAGLSGVSFRAYAAATALGIIPGCVIYTYFADSLVAGVEGASHRAFLRLAIAATLLIALSFAPWLAKRLGLIASSEAK